MRHSTPLTVGPWRHAFVAAAVVIAFLLAACGRESAGQGDSWQHQGQLLAWDGEIWIVDAVPIVVPSSLYADEERLLGSQVEAAGRYDEQGRMVAQSVTLAIGSLPSATLEEVNHEGIITSVSDTLWTVGDVAILLSNGVTIVAADGIDPASPETVGHMATVNGYSFGANSIIATDIVVTAAREQDGLSAPSRPAVTVEKSDTPTPGPSREDVPQPEPTPVPDRDDEDGGDGDDDDDDEGEKNKGKDEKDKKDEKDD